MRRFASYIGDGVTALVRRSFAHVHVIAEEPDPHDDAFVDEAGRVVSRVLSHPQARFHLCVRWRT